MGHLTTVQLITAAQNNVRAGHVLLQAVSDTTRRLRSDCLGGAEEAHYLLCRGGEREGEGERERERERRRPGDRGEREYRGMFLSFFSRAQAPADFRFGAGRRRLLCFRWWSLWWWRCRCGSVLPFSVVELGVLL